MSTDNRIIDEDDDDLDDPIVVDSDRMFVVAMLGDEAIPELSADETDDALAEIRKARERDK